MADRKVTQTGKDKDRDITKLCRPGADWSPRRKADAIEDIKKDRHTYFVELPGLGRVDIKVVRGSHGDYLRTDPDKTTRNNLDDLPDC